MIYVCFFNSNYYKFAFDDRKNEDDLRQYIFLGLENASIQQNITESLQVNAVSQSDDPIIPTISFLSVDYIPCIKKDSFELFKISEILLNNFSLHLNSEIGDYYAIRVPVIDCLDEGKSDFNTNTRNRYAIIKESLQDNNIFIIKRRKKFLLFQLLVTDKFRDFCLSNNILGIDFEEIGFFC
jgi:hypothetical protein